MRGETRPGRRFARWLAAAVALALSAQACTQSNPSANAPLTTPPASINEVIKAVNALPEGCDVLDVVDCLLPFPSNAYTRLLETPTGIQVALGEEAMPKNASSKTIDPTEWNRNDGFSPTTPILARFDRLDVEASELAKQGEWEYSTTDRSPTWLIDMTTGTRLAHFADLDRQSADPDRQALIIRSAAAFEEGHRIAVVVRHLVNDRGQTIEAPLTFRAIRDDVSAADRSDAARYEDRRQEIDVLLDELSEFEVQRSEVTLAWDFTIGSTIGLARDALTMRDRAFTRIGLASPTYGITEVITDPSRLEPDINRIVRGTISVPSFLDRKAGNGARIKRDKAGLPTYAGFDLSVAFTCVLTNRQVGVGVPAEKAMAVVYGHGLLGSRSEVERGDLAKSAVFGNFMHCAIDWMGMSESDVALAMTSLGDLSTFPQMTDRMLQGLINQQFLARALRHAQGLVNHPAFFPCAGGPNVFCTTPNASTFDTSEVFFDGNSQGGIMGGAATAISSEWTKATLGVAGMSYATLLQRSADWATYRKVFDPAYPDPVTRQILLGLIQMLWDRGETAGYVHHLSDDPYPATPEHRVLLSAAFGDHQVANLTTEMIARTAEIRYHQPALAEDRHPEGTGAMYDMVPIDDYPVASSAMFYWDSGTLAPPLGNLNPTQSDVWTDECGRDDDTDACRDPHEDPRDQEAFWEQKRVFFATGEIIDPCGAEPCLATHE